MRRALFATALTVALSACGDETGREPGATQGNAATTADPAPLGPETRWAAIAGADSYVLRLTDDGQREVRLALSCRAPGRLVVEAPGLTPEPGARLRLELGTLGLMLDAEPSLQPPAGGVRAEAPVTRGFDTFILDAPSVGVRYGAQRIAPAPPPPPGLAREFVRSCQALAQAGGGTASGAGSLDGGEEQP